MFAVIKTGGKQYRVTPGDIIVVEKLTADEGSAVTFDSVLMLGEDGKAPTVGTPMIADATVTGEVVEQGRGEKITVFKKKRRQGYRRTKGHRQLRTVLKITGINGQGSKASGQAAKKPAAKSAAKKTAKPAPKEAPKAAEAEAKAKPAAKKAPAKSAAKKPAAAKSTAAKKPAAKKPAAKSTAAKKPAAKAAASKSTAAKKPAAKKPAAKKAPAKKDD